jgi:hypothetical protein
MMRHVPRIILGVLISVSLLQAATTGKITGVVTDAETGEALPGVNVILQGTNMGAATNLEGYYVIVNVPPGTYDLKATYVGYSAYLVKNISVKIDLTTTIDMKLQQEVLEGEEVVVVAQRPVVVKDISSSQANLSMKEVESLPAVNVTSIVGTQAGIRGMTIRGGSSSETAFVVNGITLRDERDNTPYTAVSYTSVEEIKIQTGGFNAEYGNIRSGIINVVTKEGKKDGYTFSMLGRYSPVAQKHFGHSPHSPESFWIRPYVDDEVCWTGTGNGAWDEYTLKQYIPFEGFNSVAQKTLQDDNPDNDLTPYAAQRLFLWEHRRQLDIQRPDYDVDMSFGGPVPLVGDYLGDLRFFASYRNSRDMYIVPLSKDGYKDWSSQVKLTSDISPNMKLMIDYIGGRQIGTASSRSGAAGIFTSNWGIANNLSQVSFIDTRMFATDYWCPTQVTRLSLGARFTHVLNSNSFYEVSLKRFESIYDTNPGRGRDTSRVYLFGNNYYVDEAPFGFQPNPSTSKVGGGDGGGMRMGVGMSNARDSSNVTVYTANVDFNSQIDRYNNIKAGIEFTYTDNNVNYAQIDEFLISSNSHSKWHTFPKRGALYVQDKLEFEGMIANVGLRLDYSHAGGEWYEYDPFTDAFSSEFSLGVDTLLTRESTDHIFNLSPRLGVAFPISINSKLFFNYGHFRQMPTPDNLYLFRRFSDNNAVARLGNPNLPLPKTIAYELGYEHNILDQFLLRITGYYKDISQQPRLVRYTNRDNKVNYTVTKASNYRDIRGFEFTLDKNRGKWVQGFVNYTYEVITSGNFGFGTYYENPVTQRQYEREYRYNYQSKPIPQPYARANLLFFLPEDFGPRLMGIYPIADLRMNFLANWRSGYYLTWTGGGSIPGIEYNVQWHDYYNVDLRLSKSFALGKAAELQFFMDVSNLFNFKYMTNYGFYDGKDYDAYMKSLHLPADVADELRYNNIPGEDQPGDYRDYDVDFQPMELYTKDTRAKAGVIYYDRAADQYLEWADGEYQQVESGRVDKAMEEKAYIDMPNQQFFTFLDPRDIFFGIRLNLNLDF